ncbi:DNA topology modulation protein [Nitrobacter sp.]|uniref:DNA topology modulation protein n=1 Tax=Nitrobacter sp. TaxID=29420 RepID=UPI003F64D9F7
MQRILVMGSSGAGKSTFARKLAAITGIPAISLDAMYWKPGWMPSEDTEFDARVTDAANTPRWIIDGNYLSHAGSLRRDLADTVIWFDLPRRTCMIGVMIRIMTSYGRVRPEMAPKCPERLDAEFLHYVWTFRRKQRPRLADFLEALRFDQTLTRFMRRSDADRYLHDLSASGSLH